MRATALYPTAGQLKVGRLVLAVGLLSFGWFDYRAYHGAGFPLLPLPDWLRFIPWVLLPFWAYGMISMRYVRSKTKDDAHWRAITAGAWGTGSASAIMGAFYYNFTGKPLWYLVGLLAYIGSLILFPIDRPT